MDGTHITYHNLLIQTILCSLSDFDVSGRVIQFHDLGHVGEKLYNFTHL